MQQEQAEDPRLLKVGNTLQDRRYTIVERLSTVNPVGGGCVFRAQTNLTLPTPKGMRHHHVAIKQVYNDWHLAEVFGNEVEKFSQITNRRGVPCLIDSFYAEEYDSWILVMEYIAGNTLDALYKSYREHNRQTLPLRSMLDWACDLLNTLEDLHSHRFVHKDIKPANVKIPDINRTDTILLDFGFTKHTDDTQHSLQGGTWRYAPPEQFNLQSHTSTDQRSDLYSLAATLYVLLVGDEELLLPVDSRKTNPSLTWSSSYHQESIPDEVIKIIERALSLDINQRPSNATEMRQVLESARDRLPNSVFPLGTAVDGHILSRAIDRAAMSATYEGTAADKIGPTIMLRYFVPGSQPDAATIAALIERGHRISDPRISSIIATHDDSARNGTWYLMRHLQGSPLANLRSAPPRPGRIVKWLDQALCILEVFHAADEYAGTINPWSIAIDTDRQLMLLDWGPLTAAHLLQDLTPYSAPELRQSRVPTPQSDLFALAATFSYLCDGALANDAPDDAAYLADVLRQAMAAERAQRFADVAAMRRALHPLLQAEQLRAALKAEGLGDSVLISVGEQPNLTAPQPDAPERIIPLLLDIAQALEGLHRAIAHLSGPLDWTLDSYAIQADASGKARLLVDLAQATRCPSTQPDKRHNEQQLLLGCLPAELVDAGLARDQFLLAVIGYMLLTNEVPRSAHERQLFIAAGKRDPLVPPQGDDIPPLVAEVIAQALALPPYVSADPATWHAELACWPQALVPWREVYTLRQKLPSRSRIIIYADQIEPANQRRLAGYQPIARRLVSCEQILALIADLARALDVLHAQQITNIGVATGARRHPDTSDVYLLLDLGPRSAERDPLIPRAPELRHADKQGIATDQFDLAALTFRALTGRWPSVPDIPANSAAFQAELRNDLKALCPTFAAGQAHTATAISLAMSFEPTDRYPTCVDFAERLRRAMSRDGVI